MENWYILIAVAAAIGLMLVIFNRKRVAEFLRRADVQAEIARFCIAAEKYIVGTKKGAERLELVCDRLYSFLPPWAQAFVTRQMLVEAVQYVFERIKTEIDGHFIAAEK